MPTSDPPVPQALISAIEQVPVPMAVLDLISRRFVATNRALDSLFGGSERALVGRPVADVLAADPSDAQVEALDALSTRRLDGYQRLARYIMGDGSELSAEVWVRRLQLADASNLAVAVIVPSGQAPGAPSPWPGFLGETTDLAFVTTDHDWRVEHASNDVETVLGYTPAVFGGTSLLGLVHPSDAATFLLAAEHAITSKRASAVRARFKAADGSWRELVCFIAALCDHDPPRLGLLLTVPGPSRPTVESSRAEELEQHLWRIALEVRAAGLVPGMTSALPSDRAREFSELSGRQWEIVTRLVGGQSVAEIARSMYLSQSTVRNHLTTVYRKLGVHSQRELVTLLTDAARSLP